MKPNAFYYYISALAYVAFGIYIYFEKTTDSLIKPGYKIWITIILVCLGIYRAARGYQVQKSGRKKL